MGTPATGKNATAVDIFSSFTFDSRGTTSHCVFAGNSGFQIVFLHVPVAVSRANSHAHHHTASGKRYGRGRCKRGNNKGEMRLLVLGEASERSLKCSRSTCNTRCVEIVSRPTPSQDDFNCRSSTVSNCSHGWLRDH